MPRWRTVILLLVVGAVVNVAVATACARWGRNAPSVGVGPVDTVDVPAEAVGFLDAPTAGCPLSRLTEWSATRTLVAYCGWHNDARLKTVLTRVHVQVRFGFPFRSLQYVGRSSQDATTKSIDSGRMEGWRGGLPLVAPKSGGLAYPFFSSSERVFFRPVDSEVVYPLEPVVLGFAANTVIYAVVLGLVMIAATSFVRSGRRRQGLCERCKYPVGASAVCSECGKAVPRRGAETPSTRA